jgi:hypothetical protein
LGFNRYLFFLPRFGVEPAGRGTAYPAGAVPAETAGDVLADGASPEVTAPPPKPTLRTEPLESKKITCARSPALAELPLV